MQERGKSIVLIGFMGAGKSTVGRLLAERMKLPFCETDQMIVTDLGMSIPEIFERHGEEFFRDRETRVLRRIPLKSSIIVTGGGIVLRDENIRRCRELGTIVWLDADEEVVRGRVGDGKGRPLLVKSDPGQMLRKRVPLYRAAADLRIDTSHSTPDEIVTEILSKLSAES